jgi:alpha-1,3-rhamnosyl/mannosyltransferase
MSLDRVSRVIFISAWGRDLVLGPERRGSNRFPVIPFGAEHLSFDPSPAVLDRWGLEPDRFVLSVSHIYRYKRLEKLIDAYVEMGDLVEKWPLLIVGEPFDRSYTATLQEKAARSVAPIIFTGALGSDAVGSLMAFARAFVFTSEAENLPITLLEAMAAGSPIVTNRHCSMPEVCAEGALYAHPSSVDQYRRALETILGDDEERSAMRARARQRAVHFRWWDAAISTLALLHESAADRGGGRLSRSSRGYS